MDIRRSRFTLGVIAVAFLTGISLILWKRPLDLSADEVPLNRIALPPQSVGGDIFMDGGSVWVHIVDRKGSVIDLKFPYDASGKGTKYLTAFHGAKNGSERGAVAFKNADRTKEVALILLQQYGNMAEPGTARAYNNLSEPKLPEISRFLREIMSP